MQKSNPEIRKRLRINDRVAGFCRIINKTEFFSRDEFSWSGNGFDFLQIDVCTNRRDINNKLIYSEDILTWSENNQEKYCVIYYDEVLDKFQALSVDGEENITDFFTHDGFKNRVKRVSFSFVQPN